MTKFLALLCDSHLSLFIRQGHNLCIWATYSHRFPCSIDHFLSLGVFIKLAVSTVRVSRDPKTNWLIDSVVYVQVRWLGNVGEGTLGVAELAEDHVVGLATCDGGVDVVGVVTPLRGSAQVVLHGDQVAELSVLLGVLEEGEVEEDGEDQVEVPREECEVTEKRTWMTMRMGWDSRKVEPWSACDRDIKRCNETARFNAVLTGCETCASRCSCTCCWCSLCHACPHASCCWSCCKYTVSVASFLQLEMYSLHHPLVTVNCVSCYRIDLSNFAPNSLWDSFQKSK